MGPRSGWRGSRRRMESEKKGSWAAIIIFLAVCVLVVLGLNYAEEILKPARRRYTEVRGMDQLTAEVAGVRQELKELREEIRRHR